ncbi:MAG: FG-GAP-like repeat-containing protein [Isosphaeraceae bacterium]
MTRRRTVTVLFALATIIAAAAGGAAWWRGVELGAAREDVANGRLAAALGRLERLEWLSPVVGSEEQSFLLGMARWSAGRYEPALRAFARIPDGSQFAMKAAMFQAEGALREGHLRLAEQTLLKVLSASPEPYEPALEWLERLYRLEARFDDVRELLRSRLDRARDPVPLLLSLWRLDRSTVPLEGIREGLDEATRRAGGVEDDRIALGRARLALLSGNLDEARERLDRCLLQAVRAEDPALWRAWLDWAARADRPAEVARALHQLGPSQIGRTEAWSWVAWLARRRGDSEREWAALQHAIELMQQDPGTLERLASLAHARGQQDLARSFRDRKAAVDRAILEYDDRLKAIRDSETRPTTTTDQGLSLARLAESAGRTADAAAWATLAAANGPPGDDAQSLAERLARLVAAARQPASGLDLDWKELLAGPASSDAAETAKPPGDGSPTASRPLPEFADEAGSVGLKFDFHNGETPLHQMPEPLSGGLALLDYDGDGWLDVYAVQGGPFPPLPAAPACGDRLFRNKGDGSFVDATETAGVADLPGGYGHGAAAGDYDNDGDPDLFVARWRSYALLRNDGGRFVDATAGAGLAGDRDWPTSAAFADLDGDGDLDLYVCHYLRWDPDNPKLCRNAKTNAYVSCSPLQLPALPDHVFRNDGGRFVDITAQAGFVDPGGRGLAVLAAQLDDDLKIDVFVANDMTANFLFRNLGDFRFEEVGHSAGVAGNSDGGFRAGMGIACGDSDGDGRPDLVVTNFYGEGLSLYQNMGGLFFVERGRETGLAQASRYRLGFGTAFLDADNDGALDLITANGHLDDLGDVPYRMPLQFFHGEEGGILRDRTASAGPAFAQPRLGRALATGDLDNDGLLDVVVIDHNAPLVYLHNRTRSAGRWITLRLEGTKSNRDAVGAVVTVRAGGRSHVVQRFGGGSYQAAGDDRLHVGLGDTARIEEVEVRWPSGAVGRWKDLAPETGYRLREGDARARPLAGFAGRTP